MGPSMRATLLRVKAGGSLTGNITLQTNEQTILGVLLTSWHRAGTSADFATWLPSERGMN